MAEIDIGAPAIERVAYGYQDTLVGKENPSNDNGTITSVELWVHVSLENCEVATFIDGGSNVLSTRDSETIGAVTAGSKQTFSALDMNVATGDYLGMYYTAGAPARVNEGEGMWYYDGADQIPCSSVTFTWIADRTISLYGEGELAVTEKTSSETGGGVDAKASGNPLATYSRSDTGSGVEAMPARGITLPDSGSGVEHILDRALVLISESGSGLDTVLSLLGKLRHETGTGVENSYLHILEGVKSSSDTGSGVDASSLAALFERAETGEGVEAVVARALYAKEYPTGAIDLARVLTAVLTGAETGTGAEASLVAFYLKVTETGSGVDSSTLEALFSRDDVGAGAEAITLLAAMVSHDTGVGVEVVIEYFRKLIDSGQGVENLLLVGFVGRALKTQLYTRPYYKTRLYIRPYYKTRLYTSEVKQ